MWKIKIGEMVYLIHEEIFLRDQRKGFDQKFLKDERKHNDGRIR